MVELFVKWNFVYMAVLIVNAILCFYNALPSKEVGIC